MQMLPEGRASLESGDHLTRAELHRRYLTRPDIKKAELVEGIVYVGGRVRIREHGEPNAASSVSYDLHQKKEAYCRNGVPEYVVWRVLDRAIDWFRLQNDQYVLIQPDANGLIESEQFPGLRLHTDSMLAGDLGAVLAHLRTSEA